MNGFIFSGRGGELLSNRPEDQEIAVLCLHLIQVSLALVNTLMLQDVLAEKHWKELEFMVTPRTNQRIIFRSRVASQKHKRVNYSCGCGAGQLQVRVQFVPCSTQFNIREGVAQPQSVGICREGVAADTPFRLPRARSTIQRSAVRVRRNRKLRISWVHRAGPLPKHS